MSGGAFDHACFKAEDPTQVFSGLEQYKDIERYCREIGEHAIADEIFAFILLVETYRRRLQVAGERIAPLLRAVEWEASDDIGRKELSEAWQKYLAACPLTPTGESGTIPLCDDKEAPSE